MQLWNFHFLLVFLPKLAWKLETKQNKEKRNFFTQNKNNLFFPFITQQTKQNTSNIPFISLIFLSTFSETKQHALWPFIQHSNKNKLKKSICMKDLWWRNKQYQIAGLWTNSRKADVSRRSPKQSRWSLIELRILEKKSWDGLLLQ